LGPIDMRLRFMTRSLIRSGARVIFRLRLAGRIEAIVSPQFPVSVKGVVYSYGRVALLKNARDEWELPGGRLEVGESPEVCLAREVHEELGVSVNVGPLLDVWIYEPLPGRHVLIVTFGCTAKDIDRLAISAEHDAGRAFDLCDVAGLKMPAGYKASVARWADMMAQRPSATSS
jgi:8-oxo-dGTP pyrophosphatase MutT (NUDIX family)